MEVPTTASVDVSTVFGAISPSDPLPGGVVQKTRGLG